MSRQLTLHELEKLLEARKAKLRALIRRRTKIEKDLQKIDLKIAFEQGTNLAAKRKRPTLRNHSLRQSTNRAGKPASPRRNSASLDSFTTDALRGEKGLTIKQVEAAVLKAGYRTRSANFKLVVYQSLYRLKQRGIVGHNKATGKYKLR